MVSRGSNPAQKAGEDIRRARVLAHVDRTQRIAAMLDRWATENVGDEPEWDLSDVEPLAMRRSPK